MNNSILAMISFFIFIPVFLQTNISWAAEIPRYASLKAVEVNIRTGPGTSYPIRWVLTRKNMPVKIIRDFDNWRQIEIFDGDTTGWVHRTLLSSKKTAIIIENVQELRNKPDETSIVMLKLEPGVIVKLNNCTKAWCSIKVSGYEGWIRTKGLWGGIKSNE